MNAVCGQGGLAPALSLMSGVLLCSVVAVAQPRLPAGVEVANSPDGLQVVTVQRPAAKTCALRFIVRSGGNNDPQDKAGLAHMLEHLVFHGTYLYPEGRIFQRVRSVGGTVNAWTALPWTIYMLDAPCSEFEPLMGEFVALITNPALRLAKLEREKKVIDGEQLFHSVRSQLWALDQQLFPHENRGRTVIGSKKSRARVQIDDVLAYYAAHYRPQNMTALVVGNLSASRVQDVIEKTFATPPTPPPTTDTTLPVPNVPSEAKVLSGITATASGYWVHEMDLGTCHDIASLLEVRLREKLIYASPIVTSLHVVCYRSRGRTFILALGATGNHLASRLPVLMDEAFTSSKAKKPTAVEARIIRGRHAAQLNQLKHDTSAFATQLALDLGQGGEVRESLAALQRRPALSWRKMRAAMKKHFIKENHVLVHLSPFEG